MICLSANLTVFGAKNDDDYPEIILDSIPVPYFPANEAKRQEALDLLLNRTRRLSQFGADVLCLSCNTVHLFHPQLSANTSVDFISMIDLVVARAVSLSLKKLALFATPLTINSRLYQDKLEAQGIATFTLPNSGKKKYERIIRSVVAGKFNPRDREYMYRSASKLCRQNGLDGIILGCTELPLVFPKKKFKKVLILDSLDILADSLLSKINYLPNI